MLALGLAAVLGVPGLQAAGGGAGPWPGAAALPDYAVRPQRYPYCAAAPAIPVVLIGRSGNATRVTGMAWRGGGSGILHFS